MNKKGFTLVEVIAVVVIMGILALIVIPNTTRLLNEGKKEQMITEAGILISKAKYEYKMGNGTKTVLSLEDYLKDKPDGYGDFYDAKASTVEVTKFTLEEYLKDKTDGYGDPYDAENSTVEFIVVYDIEKNVDTEQFQVDLRTNNHCLSSTKDGKCGSISEKNVSNAYVVEVKKDE